MAKPFSKDLNNLSGGSYFVRNLLNSLGNKGVRVHYYTEGIETVADLAKEAKNVAHQEFPGTDIPLQSVTIKKLDGGRAIRIDRYKHRSSSSLVVKVEPKYQNVAWYDLTKKELRKVKLSKDLNKPTLHLAVPGPTVPILNYHLIFPFITTVSTPLNTKIHRMIGKLNSNPFSPTSDWGDPFPKYTLLFTAPQIQGHRQDDETWWWQGQLELIYRARRHLPGKDESEISNPRLVSGWGKMVEGYPIKKKVKDDDADEPDFDKDQEYQMVLEHDTAKFVSLNHLTS